MRKPSIPKAFFVVTLDRAARKKLLVAQERGEIAKKARRIAILENKKKENPLVVSTKTTAMNIPDGNQSQMELKASQIAKHTKKCLRQKQIFELRFTKCPLCRLSFLWNTLAAHMTKSHGQTYGTPGNLRITVVSDEMFAEMSLAPPAKYKLTPCEQCQTMVYPDAMERHIHNFHSPEAEIDALLKEAKKFSFVLLPSAKGAIREVIEKYRNLSPAHPHSFVDASFDWERLERIERFDPIARYVGVKLWKGYVVFEFQHSNRVILECPKTGNATYILSGDWRKMISSTKAEMRSEFRHLCTRIIHSFDWENRVRVAVFGSIRTSSRAQRPA